MVSKQKNIFEPVKVRPRKEQLKNEEVVSFEDSIFALNKKSKIPVSPEPLVPNKEESDDNNKDTKFLVHEDKVPLEESIFAKKQKNIPYSNVISKEKKIDYEALFNKYKDLYISEYVLNTQRLNMIDSNIFNNCCVLLEESRKTKVMNIESYDIVKKVIKSACTCVSDVFYSYTNMNSALLSLISEMNPDMDTFIIYNILDRSYIEVIDEFGGKQWQRS